MLPTQEHLDAALAAGNISQGVYNNLTITVGSCTSGTGVNVTITAPLAPTLAATGNNPVTCGANGTIDFTFTNVPNGTYTLTVTDVPSQSGPTPLAVGTIIETLTGTDVLVNIMS